MNIAFLDTETTGLNYWEDEVIELYYFIPSLQIEFEHLFKPKNLEKRENVGATEIHGITKSMLIYEQTFEYYLEQIQKDFEKVDLIVGQNIGFDLSMLHKYTDIFEKKAFCDTLEFRKYLPKFSTCKQIDLYKFCFFNKTYKAHRAKDDVLALIEIWNYLINKGVL